jgi:hypothetical protein
VEIRNMSQLPDAEALIRRIERLESELGRTSRRLRTTWLGILGMCFCGIVLASSPAAQAQFGITLTSLNSRLSVVENKTAAINYNAPIKLLTISGANVEIIDGTGSTNSASNFGNLIIGYNGLRANGNVRSGSHNLIMGDANNFSGSAHLVSGFGNEASDDYSVVIGGRGNIASGTGSVSLGGESNIVSGQNATISGGAFNISSALVSSVSGGIENQATNVAASVSGGTSNTASGVYSSVSGGLSRSATNTANWAAGGLSEAN